ncbi:MAG: 6-O-methylguanine DNA methyltransferase [Candidatus Yanofskybacteria bacterium RIFCSPHIGHO2_02_FULL_41_11]|uniref:6-O-methylguanine DNA methyltransferase n=1 Tax=Candidatus Yanofskybacteria bacterium RIFCSPHIGHO2_02_FULL_41_11 TaxID=1802675 RepID=A0A1F8FAR9_9BACT|nr:MAG: 6-O-methylguanine DNA methyltransferase [Candidatus Yanofskybacteria bacterium RIFCSPHIGHO2_02_FULL_41_11]
MTRFQEKIYNFVKLIPKGETRTYKEVATAIGQPRAYRAIGNVLGKNYNLDIPCHRIVRSDGKIGGYNRGAKNKLKLLKSEARNPKQIQKFRISKFEFQD